MPVDTSLLSRVTKLTRKDLPGLDGDEWIKMYASRDAIHDFHVQTKAQRRKEQHLDLEDGRYREGRELEAGEDDPDVVDVEDRDSAAVPTEMELHNGEFWWGIFDYMVPDFHIWDVVPGKDRRLMDGKDASDRRKLFLLLGNQLLPFLSERAGGTLVTDNPKPDGSQVTFPGGGALGDPQHQEAVSGAGT